MNSKKILLFTGLLFLGGIALVPAVGGQDTETGITLNTAADDALTARREDITQKYLPAITHIIQSLDEQNAPVPAELTALKKAGNTLQTQEDIAAFENRAKEYFGEEWKERIAQDDFGFGSGNTLLARTRIYLSSLIINAPEIAKTSPLSTEEIREKGLALIQKLDDTDEESQDIFFVAFGKTYAEIFPQDDRNDLAAFRRNVAGLLADTTDALILLVDARTIPVMQSKIANLQSRLQLVNGTQQLTAWLAQFDSFAEELLAHTAPASRELLMQDTHTLLINLQNYLQSLQKAGIDTADFSGEVKGMLTELSQMTTDEEFETFLDKLELMLSDVSDAYNTPPALAQ